MKLPTLGILLLLASGAMAATPTNLVLRSYDYGGPPSKVSLDKAGGGEFITMSAGAALRENLARVGDRDDKQTRKDLEQLGIAFPDGAWVRHLPALHRIFVLNTPDNHELLRLVLDVARPTQVAIDYAWIDLPLADIEAATRASAAIVLSDVDILALWKAGKGRLANAGRLVTRSGVNAQNQCVHEILYATDYDEAASPATNAVPREQHLLIPGSWETRQAGFILNVTPTVGPEGERIDMTLVPEHTELVRWSVDASPQPGTAVPQPLFHTQQVTTSLMLQTGHTTAFGGWTSPDGSQLSYLVLRATVVDAEMKPARPWEALERAMAEQP
jgi:hypothetical protein